MKLKYVLIVVIILIVIGFFVKRKYAEFNAVQNLEYVLGKPKLVSMSSHAPTELILPITFINPSRFELTIKTINLSIFNTEAIKLGTLHQKNIFIKPTETTIDFKMKINSKDVVKTLPQLLLKKEVLIFLEGKALYKSEIMKIPIEIPIKESFDMKKELLMILKSKITSS